MSVVVDNVSDVLTIADANNTYVTVIEPAEIYTSVVGVQGLQGASDTYTHQQLLASSTWTINHNLGRFPSIQLLSVGSVEFFGDITHTSINQSIVNLSTATAGIAQCN